MTPTAEIIFSRTPIKIEGGEMYPIRGSAEHRCCNSKAMREIGHICTNSKYGKGHYFNTSKTADQKEEDFRNWLRNR